MSVVRYHYSRLSLEEDSYVTYIPSHQLHTSQQPYSMQAREAVSSVQTLHKKE